MAKNTLQRKDSQKGKVVYRPKPSWNTAVYAHNVSLADKALVDARDTIQRRNDLLLRVILSK